METPRNSHYLSVLTKGGQKKIIALKLYILIFLNNF